MKRTSLLALSVMALAPLCMTFACGSMVTQGGNEEPPNPEPMSTCEPRQAGISADFELTVGDWPIGASTDGYDYKIAAPCQVEAASASSRELGCTDGDSVVHKLTLTIQDSRIIGAIPASGPVFLRTARSSDPMTNEYEEWFEVRAGSDVTGALLAGGARAYAPAPFPPVEGYFAPIWMVPGPKDGCPGEIQNECMTRYRVRINFWVDETPVASILDGHEGLIDASGAYFAIVGESVDDVVVGDSPYCLGDNPEYNDDVRILIGATAH